MGTSTGQHRARLHVCPEREGKRRTVVRLRPSPGFTADLVAS